MPPTITKPLTGDQAKLKDALMIIQLLYEDMIKHEVNTKARRIAGTFLYSSGYAEWTKELNQ